jgi:hypothetical protein
MVGLDGLLNEKFARPQVQETAGRDCKPGQLEDMIATLEVLPEPRLDSSSCCQTPIVTTFRLSLVPRATLHVHLILPW